MNLFGPLPKICYTYPTLMKLGTFLPYLKKMQKVYKSRDTDLDFCWHQHFFTGNQQVLLHQDIQMQIALWYIISNSFNFSESLKIVLINTVTISMMSAKMATPDLIKLKVFWSKGYDVIILSMTSRTKFYYVTQII